MKLLTIIYFTILAYSSAEKPADYRLALTAACTPRQCTSPGPLCESCTSLVACVQQDDGTYEKNSLATCKGPGYCVNGVCTSDFDPFCSGVTELPFQCNQVGVFPHPFYHNKFVFCYKDGTSFKSIVNECEDGYSFNIADDLCSVVVDNAECPHEPYPVPLCQNAGETAAIEEKPSMYYICKERTYNSSNVVVYPDLYICPGGEQYVDFQCGGTTTPIVTTPTTTAPIG